MSTDVMLGLPGMGVPEVLEWQEEALCAQTDPELFFPQKGGSTTEAKKVCRRCPVVSDCLEWAIDAGEEHGVWGGMSERERTAYARSSRRKPKMSFPVPTDAEIGRERAKRAVVPAASGPAGTDEGDE